METPLRDMRYRIRGKKPLSEKIILIYFDDTDIQQLGGWPVSYDYYIFLLNLCNQAGAKAVAFDIFFGKENSHFPEYNQAFADAIIKSGNVILPYFYQKQNSSIPDKSGPTNQILSAENPVYPFEKLKNAAHRLGFTNLGSGSPTDNLRKINLLLNENGRIRLSFPAQIASEFLDIPKDSTLHDTPKTFLTRLIQTSLSEQGMINPHFRGGLNEIRKYSFLSLVQKASQTPQMLDSLKGKIIFITALGQGLPDYHELPPGSSEPTVMIYANIVHNLIENDFLKSVPKWQIIVLFIILVTLFLIVLRKTSHKWSIVFAAAILLMMPAISVALFFLNLDFPLFIWWLAFFPALIGELFSTLRFRQKQASIDQKILQNELLARQQQLEKITSEFQLLQNSQPSEKFYKEQLHRQQQHIEQLKSEIHDLESYGKISPQITPLKYEKLIFHPEDNFAGIVKLIEKVSQTDATVLIEGETGTGKELIAHAIHEQSGRAKQPFVALNCGALPENLLESELFGHEKGAFTGAMARKPGRFELANCGTIFLDEIAETTLAFQTKLLRVLQEGTFERLGSTQTQQVNIRVIAATNKNIESEIHAGRFREDLYFRLNVFPVRVPPLRERTKDIPLLAAHFLHQFGSKHEVSEISESAMQTLQAHSWPGNVRELQNAIQRAVVYAASEGRKIIRQNDLQLSLIHKNPVSLHQSPFQNREQLILVKLRQKKFSKASVRETAVELGFADRGTVSQDFRGICFSAFVQHDFSFWDAVTEVAGTNEPKIIKRVANRMQVFLENLRTGIPENQTFEILRQQVETKYKSLPKKYHANLDTIYQAYLNGLWSPDDL